MNIDLPHCHEAVQGEPCRYMTQLFPSIFEERGLPPSEKMLERFHIMSGQIRYTSDTLKDIRDGNFMKGPD